MKSLINWIKSILFKTLAVALLLTVALVMWWGCASTQEVIEPLNIHVSEIEVLRLTGCIPLNPWIHMHFYQHEETSIIAIVHMNNGLIAWYCYLDRGELVGWQLDKNVFAETGEKKYVPDIISAEDAKWIKEILERMDRGLSPIETKDRTET